MEFKTNFTKSIIFRVSIIILICVFILISGMSIIMYFFEYYNIQKNTYEHLTLTLNRLAHDLAEPLWVLNLDEANNIISFDMNDKNITAIVVKNENDEFVIGKIKDADNKINDIITNENYFEIKSKYKLLIKNDIIKNTKLPFQIGSLEIYYTKYYIKQQINYLIITNILRALILTSLIILIIFLLLKKYIINPLSTMVNSLKKISKGEGLFSINKEELGKYIEIKTSGEIKELIFSFNIMSKELLKTYNQIEDQNKELYKIKSFLNNIIESMPSALITVDEKGIITQWNQSASNFIGKIAEDTLGKNIWNIIPSFLKYKEDFEKAISTRMKKEYRREQIFGEKDKFQNINIFPLVQNCIFGGAFRIDDVTELEKKNDQLIQAQKMETIGTLAGGIAHDFNNVLGAIIGSISLLKYKLHFKEKISQNILEDYLTSMEESAKRASDIVNQLLTISQRHEFTMVPIDLNEILKHVLKVCKNTFDKSIDINFKFYHEKAMAIGDPTQIEQVFLNLCINANHAMTIMRKKNKHQGGDLTVSIEKIEANEAFLNTYSLFSEKIYWLVCVRDTGIGMDKKIISKIFDPFFTTKDKGIGSGLGLAISYNIIKEHKGFINVYSEIGLGSSFRVYLPVSADKAILKEKKHDLKINKCSGLILVIDDEKIIRKITGDMLTECGYDVIFAENGEEAVEIFKNNSDKIICILLDMIMPKKSGKDCYLELKKIKEDIKVILTSGFRKDEGVESILKLGANDFIQKPFTLSNLIKIIKENTE